MSAGDREQVERSRLRLERERERVRRNLKALRTELEGYRQRVGERDPCAYRSPSAAREEVEQASRSRLQALSEQSLQEIEHALKRLGQDPAGFSRCERCRRPISPERLEVIPQTRLCASCATRVGR